jgi:serine/threonine-protein kinase
MNEEKSTFLSLWEDEPAHPRSTLRPPPMLGSHDPLAGYSLPTIDPGALNIGETLGEGGMGVVRLAVQSTLGREVAVKMLRPGHDSADARRKLLHEAWVTGGLEHPNVVPVYEVGQDPEGRPYLVLRRIEGVPWSALVGADDAVRARGAADPVEWHLRVLLQVCNAVAFAHSRGILHRDLKPENVMIGAFGEVYLVDWGIAVATDDSPVARIPRASDQAGPAGTPAYLAPEQLRDPGSPPLSERTDVWLLGAVLYEVLHGHPPHHVDGLTGDAVVATLLERVRNVAPAIDPLLPEDLRLLLASSLARDPALRPASAADFRAQLQRCLDQRGVMGLHAKASEDLVALEAAAQRNDGPVLLARLGACRFGFRRVLEAWPGHEKAQEGLDRALDLAARWHLQHGEFMAADLLLTEALRCDPLLRSGVDRARAEAKEREQRLEHIDDVSAGARTRLAVVGIIGAFWTLGPLLGWFFSPVFPGYAMMAVVDAVLVTVALGLGFWGRDSLSKSELNRQIRAAILLAPVVGLLGGLGAWLLGLTPEQAHAVETLTWAAMTLTVAVMVRRQFGLAAAVYAAAFLVSCVRPYWGLPAIAVANGVFVLTVVKGGVRVIAEEVGLALHG